MPSIVLMAQSYQPLNSPSRMASPTTILASVSQESAMPTRRQLLTRLARYSIAPGLCLGTGQSQSARAGAREQDQVTLREDIRPLVQLIENTHLASAVFSRLPNNCDVAFLIGTFSLPCIWRVSAMSIRNRRGSNSTASLSFMRRTR